MRQGRVRFWVHCCAMTPPSVPDATRSIREARQTVARARIGGLFYLAAWALVAGASLPSSYRLNAGFLAMFVLLAVVRLPWRSSAIATADGARRAMLGMWTLVFASNAAWGAFSAMHVLNDYQAPTATLAWMGSVALSTAVAHSLSQRRGLAWLAVTLLYAPAWAALAWQNPGWNLVVAMAAYYAYLVLSMLRAHGEFLAGETLEQQLRDQRDAFERQSRRDPLTDLFNRRRFQGELEHHIARVQAQPGRFAMLIIDIDFFKRVNDAHGHAVGDACLIAFAKLLRATFALPTDIVARLGGEEFGVLMETDSRSHAVERAEAFRILVEQQPRTVPHGVTLTCSIGLCVAEHGGQPPTAAQVYRSADAALYQAKAEGRNAVRAHDCSPPVADGSA